MDESVAPVAAPTPNELTRIRVWDPPVRLVHWAMVALLIGLVVTGLADNEWLGWHMRFGQAMLALVVFRVLWGFVGSRNARFAAFLRGPAAMARYARSLLRRPHEQHVTHNPLGGWMVVVLLVALAAQAVMGLFTNDDVLWGGPLAERVSKETSDAISSYHRRFWWVIGGLAVLHIGAVLWYLAFHRENLTSAMVDGVKTLPGGMGDARDATASTILAVVLLALSVLGVWYVANRL